MTQRVLTPEWAQQLVSVIRDNRPIMYSDGGLTVYSSHGYNAAPPHKYKMSLVQGFQDPIGVQANAIEYAYIRYVDSQLVVSTMLPNPQEALLIATIYTDTYKVTQIINHGIELPDTSNLPTLPPPPTPSPTTPPYVLPTYLKTSIPVFIEKPKVKYIGIETRAPIAYVIGSMATKTVTGSITFSLQKNRIDVSGASNLNANTTNTLLSFPLPIPINQGDEFGINITSVGTTPSSDFGLSLYAYGNTSNLISNTI